MLIRFLGVIFVAGFLPCAGIAFAAGGVCPSEANYLNSAGEMVTLASLGITDCYFIAANGSDFNTGTAKTSPWQHSPGMPTCSSKCAAHVPSAGEGFIFRGGDSWNAPDFGIQWNWAGTVSNAIYIGVDKTWYQGNHWARPIWSCGGAPCAKGGSSYYFQNNGSYTVVDSVEMTGLYLSTNVSPVRYISGCAQNQIYENIYMHGWSYDPSSPGYATGFAGCGSSGTTIRYTVVDGSDSIVVPTRDTALPCVPGCKGINTGMLYAVRAGISTAYGNVFRYVQSAITGCGDDWHDNLVEYLVANYQGPSHQDGLYQYAPCAATTVFMYNNVVRHTTWAASSGVVKFWMSGNNFNTSTGYAFNNVIYDNYPGNMVDTGGHFGPLNNGGYAACSLSTPENCAYGTWYFFNNTVECGTRSVPGFCALGDQGNKQKGLSTGGFMTLVLSNNHWISTTSKNLVCGQTSFKCKETAALVHSEGRARTEGFTSDSRYAFQPTRKNGGSVGSGVNMQSLCSTIAKADINAATACMSDTSYGCVYLETDHTVNCWARTKVARPTIGTWDVGAYQFNAPQASVSVQ